MNANYIHTQKNVVTYLVLAYKKVIFFMNTQQLTQSITQTQKGTQIM